MKKIRIANHATVLFVLSFSLSFYSCKKDNNSTEISRVPLEQKIDNSPSILNGRLVFNSHEQYYEFISKIGKRDFSKIEQLDNNPSFVSLYSVLKQQSQYQLLPSNLQDYEDMGLPQPYQKVLNKNGEVVIGNDIIWYTKNRKYFITYLDEKKLAKVKANPDNNLATYTKVGCDIVSQKNTSPNESQRTNLGTSGYTANWQLQFWQYAPAAGWRKYVHGIQAYTDTWSSGWSSMLVLNVKMEWKGKRWQPAGETRDIALNLTMSNFFYTPSQFTYSIWPAVSINNTYRQAGDLSLILGEAQGYGALTSPSGWSAEISGTIYQHVVGDVQGNEWYNTATPLW
jgi:hypothetical protein